MSISRLDLALLAGVVAAAAASTFLTMEADISRRQRVQAEEAGRDAALLVEAEFDRIERQVAWLVRPDSGGSYASDTAFVLATVPAVTSLRLIDPRGRGVYDSTRAGFALDTRDAAHTRAFLAADPDASWVSPVRIREGQPHAELALTRGGDSGVAVADLDLSFFGDVLDAAHAAPGTTMRLHDEAGTPIAGAAEAGTTAAEVPIPHAGWTLDVAAPAPALPLMRLAERFVALLAIFAAAAALLRHGAIRL